jgi:hypothetical protein
MRRRCSFVGLFHVPLQHKDLTQARMFTMVLPKPKPSGYQAQHKRI